MDRHLYRRSFGQLDGSATESVVNDDDSELFFCSPDTAKLRSHDRESDVKWTIRFKEIHIWTVSFPVLALLTCLILSILLHFEVRYSLFSLGYVESHANKSDTLRK
jgi:hypothetical protein